jgi:hypothetical protein
MRKLILSDQVSTAILKVSIIITVRHHLFVSLVLLAFFHQFPAARLLCTVLTSTARIRAAWRCRPGPAKIRTTSRHFLTWLHRTCPEEQPRLAAAAVASQVNQKPWSAIGDHARPSPLLFLGWLPFRRSERWSGRGGRVLFPPLQSLQPVAVGRQGAEAASGDRRRKQVPPTSNCT